MVVVGQSKFQCYKTVWAESLNLSFFRFPLEQRCSKIHYLKPKNDAEKVFLPSSLYLSQRTLFFKSNIFMDQEGPSLGSKYTERAKNDKAFI